MWETKTSNPTNPRLAAWDYCNGTCAQSPRGNDLLLSRIKNSFLQVRDDCDGACAQFVCLNLGIKLRRIILEDQSFPHVVYMSAHRKS